MSDGPYPGDFEERLLASCPRSERFPGEHQCPRGHGDGAPFPFGGKAVWRSDETCSYCGSVHPDVVMERLEAGTVLLGSTSKDYKVYLHSPEGTPLFRQSFRGDGDPGGTDPSKWVWTTRETRDAKFYFMHFSEQQMRRFIELYNEKRIKFEGGLGFTRLPYFCASRQR